MSGAAAASNRLTMFSAFISLDGVAFGGGGTVGLSWTGTEARYRDIRFLLHDQISGLCWTLRLEKQQLATLDGDLGIGGGPPGLRVWLAASLTLLKCRHATFQSKSHTCWAKSGNVLMKVSSRSCSAGPQELSCKTSDPLCSSIPPLLLLQANASRLNV